MTGTLALIGGGEWTEGCDFDAELLADSGGDEVVVLPTAAAYENPHKIGDRAVAWFEQLGGRARVLDVLRRADGFDPAVVETVAGARFLYLAGGSPMHLRSVLKDSPLWDAIVRAWRGGAVLAGAAEGATVLSTHMVDSRGGAFTVGLDLLEAVTVIPRYNLWSEDKWHRTVHLAPPGMTVLGIDERTAALVDAAGWRASGAGRVTAYRDGSRVELADVPVPAGV
jgi:cyanophycinase